MEHEHDEIQKQNPIEYKTETNQKTIQHTLEKPFLDPGTLKTVLDSESEGDVGDTFHNWGSMTKTTLLVSVSDEQESDSNTTTNRTSKSKRSPNRDDDSDDSDQELKTNQNNLGFVPDLDPEYIKTGFKVGFSEDRNKRFRRTMEDAHSILLEFNSKPSSGFFAIFDGHAGRSAADYCGSNLYKHFQQLLIEKQHTHVSELLRDTFLMTDIELEKKKGMHSGCTAIIGYIQSEERLIEGVLKKRRVLYTANVGDARAVLSRNGKAHRLSFDHKGSDPIESRRILESGGFMMNNRVNGVLAVTRSLGDHSMKEWVIGTPYTTETVLNEHDTTLILACDGIWDVLQDQEALDLVVPIVDPQEQADVLVDYALDNRSTDNLTVICVRINPLFY